jgi:hypothetical protein
MICLSTTEIEAYCAEVIKENMHPLTLNTVILDDDARAPYDLPWVALAIDFAEPSPSPENLCISDLDQVNLVFGAQSLDELDVLRLSAGLDKDTKVRLALIKGLCRLTKPTSKAVVDQRVLQNLLKRRQGQNVLFKRGQTKIYLKSFLDGELSLGGFRRYFDLRNNGAVDFNTISSVRHSNQKR